MASVNKVIIDIDRLRTLYVDQLKSIPQVSIEIGASQSTIRARLKECGLLRARAEAIRIARDQGRLGSGGRGKKRIFTEEWKRNLSSAIRASRAKTAAGVSLKPSGYVEFTMGEHKWRSQHVVFMEELIGRRLHANEVVHHIDHNRSNNDPSNLQLMTRSAHSRLHRLEELEKKHG